MERETIIYNGNKYHRYPNSKHESVRSYFRAHFKKSPTYLHRQVWEDANGDIPDGYEVHHKDGNPANNQISNLELRKRKEHQKYHGKQLSKAQRDELRDRINEIRHLASEWHGSEEGIAWHREHGKRTWETREPIEVVCKECGATFTTKTYHQEYCSNKCKAKARRKSGVDNVVKKCEFCGAEYTTDKYSKSRFCSNKCGKLSYWAKIQK
jgi:endogenous inhibitor of DNA gyrase (YacG/DUF329 family)